MKKITIDYDEYINEFASAQTETIRMTLNILRDNLCGLVNTDIPDIKEFLEIFEIRYKEGKK